MTDANSTKKVIEKAREENSYIGDDDRAMLKEAKAYFEDPEAYRKAREGNDVSGGGAGWQAENSAYSTTVLSDIDASNTWSRREVNQPSGVDSLQWMDWNPHRGLDTEQIGTSAAHPLNPEASMMADEFPASVPGVYESDQHGNVIVQGLDWSTVDWSNPGREETAEAFADRHFDNSETERL